MNVHVNKCGTSLQVKTERVLTMIGYEHLAIDIVVLQLIRIGKFGYKRASSLRRKRHTLGQESCCKKVKQPKENKAHKIMWSCTTEVQHPLCMCSQEIYYTIPSWWPIYHKETE